MEHRFVSCLSMMLRCFWESLSRLVHCCPSRPTNWRESVQIGHSGGGSADGGNCAPHVKQINAVLIRSSLTHWLASQGERTTQRKRESLRLTIPISATDPARGLKIRFPATGVRVQVPPRAPRKTNELRCLRRVMAYDSRITLASLSASPKLFGEMEASFQKRCSRVEHLELRIRELVPKEANSPYFGVVPTAVTMAAFI